MGKQPDYANPYKPNVTSHLDELEAEAKRLGKSLPPGPEPDDEAWVPGSQDYQPRPRRKPRSDLVARRKRVNSAPISSPLATSAPSRRRASVATTSVATTFIDLTGDTDSDDDDVVIQEPLNVLDLTRESDGEAEDSERAAASADQANPPAQVVERRGFRVEQLQASSSSQDQAHATSSDHDMLTASSPSSSPALSEKDEGEEEEEVDELLSDRESDGVQPLDEEAEMDQLLSDTEEHNETSTEPSVQVVDLPELDIELLVISDPSR